MPDDDADRPRLRALLRRIPDLVARLFRGIAGAIYSTQEGRPVWRLRPVTVGVTDAPESRRPSAELRHADL